MGTLLADLKSSSLYAKRIYQASHLSSKTMDPTAHEKTGWNGASLKKLFCVFSNRLRGDRRIDFWRITIR